MRDLPDHYKNSISVAKMYYYQGLTTEQIAEEMRISRPTISRLLNFARTKGLIEITVHDSDAYLNVLEQEIREKYGIANVHVVLVPETNGEEVWLQRVASFAASYLNSLLEDNQILGLAWGTTLSTIGRYLIPKVLKGVDIVQLNGSGNTTTINNTYASEIIMRFGDNYSARTHLFPVPTFFDVEETKQLMWRERSIRRILDMQQKADVLLFSLGAVDSGKPSHVYSDGYLEKKDIKELKKKKVIADLATVFFSEDGSYDGIALNKRSSGPSLSLYQKVPHAICVASGRHKVPALRSALAARYMNDLIVDEPTARLVMRSEIESLQSRPHQKGSRRGQTRRADRHPPAGPRID